MCNQIKTKTTDEKFYVWSPYLADFVSRAKKLGGKWDRNESAWVFNVAFVDAVREAMRKSYHQDDLQEPEKITVKVTFGDEESVCCGSVVMFGKTLARAYGRDSGAKVGEDVALVSGRIDSGGSMKNWTSIVYEGSSFVLTNVIKAAFEAEKNVWERDCDCVFEVVSETVDKEALEQERARLVARIAEIDALLAKNA